MGGEYQFPVYCFGHSLQGSSTGENECNEFAFIFVEFDNAFYI